MEQLPYYTLVPSDVATILANNEYEIGCEGIYILTLYNASC